ncbi:MAG: NAD(P)H-hydrate dehydratase [Candidatus Omnitrophica bacterium]|nr:NAD(P)H-hydrate dehydratase [Candidatus Omnitrophota bacterium]
MKVPAVLLRKRQRVHKGSFGHLLVVAGSPSMLGAACLVALASMRSGVGMVTAAIPARLNLGLQKKIAHVIMTLALPGLKGEFFAVGDLKVLAKQWPRFTAVAIGPGIGTQPSTAAFVRGMLAQCPLPMVVDADALNALALSSGFRRGAGLSSLSFSGAPRIFTPHPGEFFRLTGFKPSSDRDRASAAKAYAKANRVVIALKGHHTVVASPEGRVFVNDTGDPGMAKAGMGDVLTGIIGALLAQGVPAFEAVRYAVHWHGALGSACVKRQKVFSLTASDLIDQLTVR